MLIMNVFFCSGVPCLSWVFQLPTVLKKSSPCPAHSFFGFTTFIFCFTTLCNFEMHLFALFDLQKKNELQFNLVKWLTLCRFCKVYVNCAYTSVTKWGKRASIRSITLHQWGYIRVRKIRSDQDWEVWDCLHGDSLYYQSHNAKPIKENNSN